MTRQLEDLAYWAIAPSYIMRSKLTKDEKIIVPILMAFMDEGGYWNYDSKALALAVDMSVDEVERAVDRLKRRGLASFDEDGRFTVAWAYKP